MANLEDIKRSKVYKSHKDTESSTSSTTQYVVKKRKTVDTDSLEVHLWEPDIIKELIQNNQPKLRVVVVSDTHNNIHKCSIPDGDIFIHCGDFSYKRDWGKEDNCVEVTITLPESQENNNQDVKKHKTDHGFFGKLFGKKAEDEAKEPKTITKVLKVPPSVIRFNDFIGKLPHKYKIVIGGNHEIGFNDWTPQEIQGVLSNCTYLQDTSISIEGIKIWGSPWTTSHNMGFSMPRQQHKEHWKTIPSDTDILMTHLPPLNIRDLASGGEKDEVVCEVCDQVHPYRRHWGNYSLYQNSLRVKPSIHLFGHVHECWGVTRQDGLIFVNAAADVLKKAVCFDFYLCMTKAKTSS